MNETLKNILKYVGEVISLTAVWSLLDYFTGEKINIIENLIGIAIAVLILNIISYIVKKNKKKK